MWWIAMALAGDLPEGIVRQEDVPWKAEVRAEYVLTDETVRLDSVSCLAEATFSPDGSVKVAGVGGCLEPIASAVHGALEASVAKKSFAAATPTAIVLVKIDRPAVWRDTKETATLAQAVRVEKPEKYYDKPVFLPRGIKPGSCAIELWVDIEGAPYVIDMRQCRENLALGIQGAVSQWRYTPVIQDENPVPARFMDTVSVKARPGK